MPTTNDDIVSAKIMHSQRTGCGYFKFTELYVKTV